VSPRAGGSDAVEVVDDREAGRYGAYLRRHPEYRDVVAGR
jgi:hypothetical protein